MMSYINETDFVIENKELVYPEIVTDGLQLYYDAKGKRDTDYHRDTMLDMSGNKNHGKLHNFAYEKHSGYKDGLVFDYIDDKLVRPALNLQPDDFTFMLNGNIISFSPDGTVKRVQDGEVIESKGFNLIRNGDFSDGLTGWRSATGPLPTLLEGRAYFERTPEMFPSLRQDPPLSPGDVIYSRLDVKHTQIDNTTTSPYGLLNNTGLPSWLINFRNLPLGSCTVSHRWTVEEVGYLYINSALDVSFYVGNIQVINLTQTFGAGSEPTKEQMDAIIDQFGFVPNAQDLIDRIEYKGNMLGDMENIIDGLYKTEVLSGEEIFTDKADDSVVHVEVDGKSEQEMVVYSSPEGVRKETGLPTSLDIPVSWRDLSSGGKIEMTATIPYHTNNILFCRYEGNYIGYGQEGTWGQGFYTSSMTPAEIGQNGKSTITFTINNVMTDESNLRTVWDGAWSKEVTYYRIKFFSNTGEVLCDLIPVTKNVTINEKTVQKTTMYDIVSREIINVGRCFNNVITPTDTYELTAVGLEKTFSPIPSPDYPSEIVSLNNFDVVSQKSEGGTIDGIEFGGRNYVLNSDFLEEQKYWVLQGERNALFSNSTVILSSDNELPRENDSVYQNLKIERDVKVTASVLVKGEGVLRLRFGAGDVYKKDFTINSPDEFIKIHADFPNTGNQNFMLMLVGKGELIITNVKLEKGNKATDWTPAPEDIAEDTNHPLIDKINLLLSEPLRSVGDVKDRLFRDTDGLWKIERNVGEIILDGSRKYTTRVNYNPEYSSYYLSNSDIAVGAKMASSHYPFLEHSGAYLSREGQQIRNYSDTSASIMITDYTMTRVEFQNKLRDSPVTVVYEKRNPGIETLDQELQDKLNNLRSFEDSNYVYTVLNKTDILSGYVAESLKPTLHAKFLYNNWYKEDRVINNLMIYNRALTNEEMLQNYKTIKRRWGM